MTADGCTVDETIVDEIAVNNAKTVNKKAEQVDTG